MKTRNILLIAVLGIFILIVGFNFAKAEGNSMDAVFGTQDSADLSDSNDISDSDIVQAETEIETEKVRYLNRTVSTGSGWIIAGEKGALLQIHLVSGYSDNKTISKGWLKAGKLKLKIQSTENTATKKIFNVSGGDGSVSGTLILNRGSTYQTGFAVWSGDLTLRIGTNRSFDSKVNLAIEEKQIGKGKLKEQRDKKDDDSDKNNSKSKKNNSESKKNEDRSGSGNNLGSKNSGSEDIGFWKRFIEFFG